MNKRKLAVVLMILIAVMATTGGAALAHSGNSCTWDLDCSIGERCLKGSGLNSFDGVCVDQ